MKCTAVEMKNAFKKCVGLFLLLGFMFVSQAKSNYICIFTTNIHSLN